MPKEEWGVKRICPTTGRRFYDLGKTPIISPYTGDTVVVDANSRTRVAAEDAKSVKEEVVEDDQDEILIDDEDDGEAATSDDLLDDDEEEDTVSLDEIADVAANDDDD